MEGREAREGGWSAVPVLVHALVHLELGLELGPARVERVEHDGADERANFPDVASVRLSLSTGKNMRASKASNQKKEVHITPLISYGSPTFNPNL